MSRFIKGTLTGFKTFNIYQKISVLVLVLSVPLIIALSVSAMSTPSEIETNNPEAPLVTDVVDAESESLSSELSSSEEIKEDVKVTLKSSSVKEDLEVKIVDEAGNLIVGPNFVLNVQSDETKYDKDWDVNDGFLKLTKLKAGEYTVGIEALEGYIMPEDITIEVEEAVEYKEQDVSDKVVDESDIDASVEDNAYGSSSGGSATPPPLTNTVDYVASKTETKDVKVEIEVDYYKPVLHEDGSIKNPDGTSSGIYPKLDENGYLVGAYKNEVVASNVSLNYYSVAPKNLTYNLSALNIIGVTDTINETESSSSPAPGVIDPPADSSSDTTSSDTTQSSSEESSSSSQESSSSSQESSSSSQESSSSSEESSSSSSSSTSSSESQESSSSDSSSSNTTQKVDVVILNADGTIKTGTDGKPIVQVEVVTVKETETKEVTYYYGWQTQGGKKYYYDKNGKKVTGTQIIQGVSYIFDNDGVLQEGDIIGIDVSKWQNNIDWNVVKDSGVDWVIIRVGYRGYSTGRIVEDTLLHSHITGAKNAGLKVGLYFFSQAKTAQEGVEEASFAIQKARQYGGVDLPIFFDSEYSTSAKTGRADALSQSQRTEVAKAFCETVESAGYQAGIYASKSWFYYNLDYSQISQYDIWVAHYTSQTDFAYRYDIWQYTGSGTWPGIAGHVDINIGYKHY